MCKKIHVYLSSNRLFMKKVAVYGYYRPEKSFTYLLLLLDILLKKEYQIVFQKDFYNKLLRHQTKLSEGTEYLLDSYPKFDTFSSYEDLSDEIEVMFTYGGDGTILRAVTFIRDKNIPVFGINAGRLGFLATVPKELLEKYLYEFFDGNYSLSSRNLVAVHAHPNTGVLNGLNFALNELVVNRKNTTAMISIDAYLDNEYLSTYWADGLIISTPTGSTAYSLSCGGPIVMPESENFIINPIAPHNLTVRPLIIPNNFKIRLKVDSREPEYLISLDSRVYSMPLETELEVSLANFKIQLVQFEDNTFIKTLQKKLFWGKDERN